MASYQFHGQLPDEEVVLFTRQHPFVLIHTAAVSAVIAALPVLVWLLAGTGLLVTVTVLVGFTVSLLLIVLGWYKWHNTVFMLTTHRVLFLEQKGLFTREMAECPLVSVQQVSHTVRGIIPTLAGYGSLAVATSGSVQALEVRGLPDPYEIQEEITAAQRGGGSNYE